MIITVSVRVCLIHEPWNHCPAKTVGGSARDNGYRFRSCDL